MRRAITTPALLAKNSLARFANALHQAEPKIREALQKAIPLKIHTPAAWLIVSTSYLGGKTYGVLIARTWLVVRWQIQTKDPCDLRVLSVGRFTSQLLCKFTLATC